MSATAPGPPQTMCHLPYDEREARLLLPLLKSIGREIAERQRTLLRLERDMPSPEEREACREWSAELAVQRRELRMAHLELERLGCSLVGRRPLTIRIPRRAPEGRGSFLWQGGELLTY